MMNEKVGSAEVERAKRLAKALEEVERIGEDVVSARRAYRRSQQRRGDAMSEASAAGASLRVIAEAAGVSHTAVAKMLAVR